MAIATSSILDVLAAHNIRPVEDDPADLGLPGIGKVDKDETVYSTSTTEVLGLGAEPDRATDILATDDPRLRGWWSEIERIIQGRHDDSPTWKPGGCLRADPPEPDCAWYCPVHFFGHGWGIYIRERCILSQAIELATFVDWQSVSLAPSEIARHLIRSAFYVFFLHEQFHHKVESLGFRLLVSTGTDRYRPYKQNVYRPTYLTSDCLEESLANAESYRRLSEPRYVRRVDPAIRDGLRAFLIDSIHNQPPGYQEGVNYLSEPCYRAGLYDLQSHVLDGGVSPHTPAGHWSVAPRMITSLADITDDIYVVLPVGAQPIFRPTSVDPGATASSKAIEGALTRYHGYQSVPGGKGSHIKLKKLGAPTIILPGNRPVLSPGVVKHALGAIGGYPISRLRDLLDGKLKLDA